MSVRYRAISWNPQKTRYDTVLAGGVVAYLALFVGAGALLHPDATAETLLIRALGTAALLLLHVVLSIGPLARLDRRFLPLLYNRRHLGVTTFLLGLAHGLFSLVQFHALGDANPLRSLLTANPRADSLAQFPFELLGLAALAILFLMAATSHDFWLKNLSPPVWKALHMAVYAAYGLLVLHVALGVLQLERAPLLVAVLFAGMAWVLALHLLAGWREHAADRQVPERAPGYVEVCRLEQIPEGRARVVRVGGERVAVFRHEGKVHALSNLCAHQNGPLGEGRVVNGCVTCPWHGYQYLPETGQSPPPFTEAVATYPVRVVDGRVQVGRGSSMPRESSRPAAGDTP